MLVTPITSAVNQEALDPGPRRSSMTAKREVADHLATLRSVCERFVTAAMMADASLTATFDWVASQMHGINHCVFEAESTGVAKDEILATLAQVRLIQAQSPFVARLQSWPRGYPGDFETVEYLMTAENRAEHRTVAYWIERYCLNTAIAQQHRNKVRWQADLIEQVINAAERADRHARILILACGSSPDVRLCQDRIAQKEFELVLNDMDEGALEFSTEKLDVLGNRVKIVPGNTFRQINKFAAIGPFDLVLAGGLFDYLKDDQAAFLIKAITSQLLSPTGKFAFTNIARPNPYKYWMEYCANWFLIERDGVEIEQLCLKIGIDPKRASLTRDPTHLTNLIVIDGCHSKRSSEMRSQSAPILKDPEQIKNEAFQLMTEVQTELLAGDVDTGLTRLTLGLTELRNEAGPEAWAEFATGVFLSHPLVPMMHQDPFTHHSFKKPRNYSGDADLLDYMYGLKDPSPDTTKLGLEIFAYTTNTPAPQSVRERRRIIADMIDGMAEDNPNLRILSIACGHLREAIISKAVTNGRVQEFLALDQDPLSLELVDRELSKHNVKMINSPIKNVLAEKLKFRNLDFVYAAGLYDYLHQAFAQRLTAIMFEMVKPGGKILVANFAPTLRDIAYLETFMQWKLIYRNETEVADFAREIPDTEIDSQRSFWDESGNVIYLEIKKR